MGKLFRDVLQLQFFITGIMICFFRFQFKKKIDFMRTVYLKNRTVQDILSQIQINLVITVALFALTEPINFDIFF